MDQYNQIFNIEGYVTTTNHLDCIFEGSKMWSPKTNLIRVFKGFYADY